jgi:hypothetical protein
VNAQYFDSFITALLATSKQDPDKSGRTAEKAERKSGNEALPGCGCHGTSLHNASGRAHGHAECRQAPNLIMMDIMATVPTEKHGNKQYPFE